MDDGTSAPGGGDPVAGLIGRSDGPLAPPAAFADGLRGRLLAELGAARAETGKEWTMDGGTTMLGPNGTATVGARWRSEPARAESRRRRLRPALDALTAAVLIGVVLASALAGWGLRPAGGGRPTALPAIALATPGAAVVDGAAMFLGNAARTGEMPGPGPAGEPDERWCVFDAAPEGVRPYAAVVANGMVYLGGPDVAFDPDESPSEPTGQGDVAAYDVETGAERWRVGVDPFGVSVPAVAWGVVVVGTDSPRRSSATAGGTPDAEIVHANPQNSLLGGGLVALDAESGERRWSVWTSAPVAAAPAVVDGVVYARANDAQVVAVDAATGRERWRSGGSTSEVGGTEIQADSALAVADGVVYSASAGLLRSLDAATGRERWRAPLDGGLPGTPVIVAETVHLVAGDGSWEIGQGDVRIVAFDTASGAVRWSETLSTSRPPVPAPAADSDRVYLANVGSDGHVRALDLDTGAEVWRFVAPFAVVASPTLVDDILYLTSLDGRLYALDAGTGRPRWDVGIGREAKLLASPVVVGGAAYVVDARGTLHALGEKNDVGSAATPGVADPATCERGV